MNPTSSTPEFAPASSAGKQGSTRRDFLRNGSMVISLGAVLAACGAGRQGVEEPGRIGLAPPPATLPPVELNDITLLRTAQSIEYTLLDLYGSLDLSGLPKAAGELTAQFIKAHTAHADALGKLITQQGGEPFACANPFLMERIVTPVVEAYDGSDDKGRDVGNIVYSFEAWAAASYQSMTNQLTDAKLRPTFMTIGADDNRHAAAVGYVMNPSEPFGPSVFAQPVDKNEDGFYTVYAIPNTFGALNAVNLVLGKINSDNVRYTVQLQTPAENTFRYEGMACPTK